MNAITTHTTNSFLLNNIPFDKHYSFIVEKHFVSNINKNEFTVKYITKVSLVNHFDSNDKLLSNQLLKDISIDGTVYISIVDFMNAFDILKNGSGNTISATEALLQGIANNTALTNTKLDSVITNEVLQTEDLDQIRINTTEVPVTNWQSSGSGAVVIPSNSQRAISIKAVTDLEVTINGVTVTWMEGETITYGDGDGILLNAIEIISGDWHIIGDGTPVYGTPPLIFDVTADWANINGYPVTDQDSFELFLSERTEDLTNDLTNIVITDFELVDGRLRCNLSANGTALDLSRMQVVDVNGLGNIQGLQELHLGRNQLTSINSSIALPSSLQGLNLNNNQLTSFNPSIALPSSLQGLNLKNNQLTTQSYIDAETWANAQPSFTSLCQIYTNGNPNSGNGTNLDTILNTKNANIIN